MKFSEFSHPLHDQESGTVTIKGATVATPEHTAYLCVCT